MIFDKNAAIWTSMNIILFGGMSSSKNDYYYFLNKIGGIIIEKNCRPIWKTWFKILLQKLKKMLLGIGISKNRFMLTIYTYDDAKNAKENKSKILTQRSKTFWTRHSEQDRK